MGAVTLSLMLSLLRTEAQGIRHRRFLIRDAVASSPLPGEGAAGPCLSREGGVAGEWGRGRQGARPMSRGVAGEGRGQ